MPSYAAHLLPAMVLSGVGLGLAFAPATDFAIRGVAPADAGVASGLVNATSQVGGSLSLALLSTLAATATSHYLAGNQHSPSLIAHAAVHGYTTAFWWTAAFFAAGALLTGLLLHDRAPSPARRPGDQTEPQPVGAD